MNIYFSNHVQDEPVIYNKKPGQIYYNILHFLLKNEIKINIERRKHILAVEIKPSFYYFYGIQRGYCQQIALCKYNTPDLGFVTIAFSRNKTTEKENKMK